MQGNFTLRLLWFSTESLWHLGPGSNIMDVGLYFRYRINYMNNLIIFHSIFKRMIHEWQRLSV